MQSFLGSLNYYSRFIEDFAVYASVLYELREADFHEINRVSEAPKPTSAVRPDAIHERSAGSDRELYPKPEINVDLCPIEGDDLDLYPKPEIDVDRYPIAGDDRDLYPRLEIDVDRYPIAGTIAIPRAGIDGRRQ